MELATVAAGPALIDSVDRLNQPGLSVIVRAIGKVLRDALESGQCHVAVGHVNQRHVVQGREFFQRLAGRDVEQFRPASYPTHLQIVVIVDDQISGGCADQGKAELWQDPARVTQTDDFILHQYTV